MNNITTTILQDTAKNINKEYSQNGFMSATYKATLDNISLAKK